MSQLSAQQKQKIEENRRKALERRAERRMAVPGKATPTTWRATLPTTAIDRTAGSAVVCRKAAMSEPAAATSNPTLAAGSRIGSVVNKNTFYGTNKQTIAGSFKLLSSERFIVDIGYNQEIINKFKLVAGRMYHPAEKHWSFPISSHDQLVACLRDLRPAVTFASLPAHVLRCLRQPVASADSVDLSRLDPVLLEAMMPFQREGVQRGVRRGGRVLLADDMGLGKTIQAIGIMAYFHDWPLLVVCPSSMRHQWRKELHRFLPSQHPSTIVVMDTSKEFSEEARVLIISYDLVTRCSAPLLDAGFLSVIMDESHCLKNHKAARTRAAVPLMRAARRCLLLSGTPALSRPIELFTQLCAVDRAFAPSFQEFGLRYCAGTRTAWGWNFSGSSNMAELQILLDRRIMIRRLKSDVMAELPAKRRRLVVLDASQVSAGTQAMTRMEQRMCERSVRGMERRGQLLQYFRETATAKLPAVCAYLDTLLEAGNKFICFAHHSHVLDAICDLLERRQQGYIRIDGATSSEQRQKQCERFQVRQDVRVAALSITAANVGITLTSAPLVVFAELFWNPGLLTQAEDRAHRIGQQDSVQVHYLVARGTADDHIWPLVQRKLDVLNKAGLSKDDFTDADELQQRPRPGQPTITDFFRQFEDLPPEALLEMCKDVDDTDAEQSSPPPKRSRAACGS